MISIIVPVYNNSLFLDECVKSVVLQTYYDWELILVDDGSTDESGEICDSWSKKDVRIRTIHQINAGVSAARNRGILESKGDYLMFLDSDDSFYESSCLLKLLQRLQETKVDCVVFGFKQASGSIWAPPFEKVYSNRQQFLLDFSFWLQTELLSSSVNKLYKKKLLNQLFPEDMSYGEDLVFSLNYLKQCKRICFVPWPYYFHNNINDHSITHTFRKSQIYDIERWQTTILQFLDKGSESRSLYSKYIKDVMLWLKRFYASNDMGRKEKKTFLKQWYRQSYLKKVSPECRLSIVERFILWCLRWNLWLLPDTLLTIKYRLKQRT